MARSVDKTKNPRGLTDQQLRFCQEYAKSLNATAAYKAAGYAWKTDTVARANSARLIANDSIKAYLGEVLSLTTVSVVHETVAIALAKITDVMEWDEEGVSVISSRKMGDRGKSAIKTIKCKTRSVKDRETGIEIELITEWEVTLHDKLSAIEKLMKKLNLYHINPPSVAELAEAMLDFGYSPAELVEALKEKWIKRD